MRAVFGLVLIVGMALAGMAVYMIQGYMADLEGALQREKAFNSKAGKLVEVYVFKKAKKYGDPLEEGDVELIYWPEKSMPKTIYKEKEVLFPEGAPGPRYVLRTVEAFEPVLESRITEPGELASLTSKLTGGMRAFAIRVGTASGVSAFVKPDDFIDIYWTGTPEGSGTEVTRLIESAITVIAVDSAFNEGQVNDGSVAKAVTVAATPEQVARLTQAQASGKLSLSLVGDVTQVVEGTIEVDTNTMLGIEEEKVEVVEAPKICTIKSNKGGVVEEKVIPCKD
jgi:pilus assembly protein CpaB